MELDFRKKSGCDRMMRSKSFDTQGVREIGWKEAGESRGFRILWMGIIEDVFQMKDHASALALAMTDEVHRDVEM